MLPWKHFRFALLVLTILCISHEINGKPNDDEDGSWGSSGEDSDEGGSQWDDSDSWDSSEGDDKGGDGKWKDKKSWGKSKDDDGGGDGKWKDKKTWGKDDDGGGDGSWKDGKSWGLKDKLGGGKWKDGNNWGLKGHLGDGSWKDGKSWGLKDKLGDGSWKDGKSWGLKDKLGDESWKDGKSWGWKDKLGDGSWKDGKSWGLKDKLGDGSWKDGNSWGLKGKLGDGSWKDGKTWGLKDHGWDGNWKDGKGSWGLKHKGGDGDWKDDSKDDDGGEGRWKRDLSWKISGGGHGKGDDKWKGDDDDDDDDQWKDSSEGDGGGKGVLSIFQNPIASIAKFFLGLAGQNFGKGPLFDLFIIGVKLIGNFLFGIHTHHGGGDLGPIIKVILAVIKDFFELFHKGHFTPILHDPLLHFGQLFLDFAGSKIGQGIIYEAVKIGFRIVGHFLFGVRAHHSHGDIGPFVKLILIGVQDFLKLFHITDFFQDPWTHSGHFFLNLSHGKHGHGLFFDILRIISRIFGNSCLGYKAHHSGGDISPFFEDGFTALYDLLGLGHTYHHKHHH